MAFERLFTTLAEKQAKQQEPENESSKNYQPHYTLERALKKLYNFKED